MIDQADRGQYDINCDELYNDDIIDADEEYPREDDDGHPESFASINQIVAYYERQGIFNEEDDALGS